MMRKGITSMKELTRRPRKEMIPYVEEMARMGQAVAPQAIRLEERGMEGVERRGPLTSFPYPSHRRIVQ